MLNAVGIDVSKGKSTVTILQPGGVIIRKPFNVEHSQKGLLDLSELICSLPGESRAVMECTGRYHEPVLLALHEAGIFTCAVNPHLIKDFGNNSLRKVKSDPADSKKIAKYALDNWEDLRQYSPMDTVRNQLKTLNTQKTFLTGLMVSAKTNLISMSDMTFPGVNELFSSPKRPDGSEKWVDFLASFWHVDCVRKIGLRAFTTRYQAFCKRHGYNFSEQKAQDIFAFSRELVPTVPKDAVYKELVMSSIDQFRSTSVNAEKIRQKMDELASSLPEYQTVLSMKGVGKTLGPQLIAEIGDITRYTHREALTAFAGVDPGVDDSGKRISKSNRATKIGSAKLRKTLFLIMSCLLQTKPEGDPVYDFLDKKRSEGKPYLVYMTAGANKFLRIYYGKVKECIRNLEKPE